MWRFIPSTLVTLVTLTACSTLQPPGAHRAYLVSDEEYALPVRSIVDLRFASVVRQQYDFSCGSAALATLLTYHYRDRQTEPAVFLGMWQGADQSLVRQLGFSLLDMKRYLASRALDADGYAVSLAQIEQTRVPGIALIDVDGYKHFVVIKGLDGRAVLVGDPALGVHRISRSDFARMWNGIYFVINSPVDVRRPLFDSSNDWALAPTPRLASLSAPLDLQALALTRPLPGEL
jgi:uncharacterized protein